MNSPVVSWNDDIFEFSMQKDFVFGERLNCRLEIINCALSVENYSEIVEAIARDVFSVDGEVNVSETEYEVGTTFKFDGVRHEQTHIFVELASASVAHLTVFSKVSEGDCELLRTFLKSVVVKSKILIDSKNLDMLSFSVI